jgi:DNA-binding NarL/FixJ family response regulator
MPTRDMSWNRDEIKSRLRGDEQSRLLHLTPQQPDHERATVKAYVSRLPTKLELNNPVQVALVVHDAGLA